MFRTIPTLVLILGSITCVSRATAQDPVTQRPGKSQPVDSTTKSNAEAGKGTTAPANAKYVTLWGEEDLDKFGKLGFVVYEGGKVAMVDVNQRPVYGSAKMEGARLTITFTDCVYEGDQQGNVVSGKARFTSGDRAGTTWNFRVVVQDAAAFRTFSGRETLPNYGDLTFRFQNDGNVDMVDKDGTTRGSYVLKGNQVTLTFGDAIYQGELRNGQLTGTARNGAGANWTFGMKEMK